MARRRIAAGNWKMHGLEASLEEVSLIGAAAGKMTGMETVLCLPATLIARARGLSLSIGGQDCHASASGAHTGDCSAGMLADAGASFVIVGHSERRADHGESDSAVAAKAEAAWGAGLTAILCVGETEEQYRAGGTLDALAEQLAGSLPKGATPGNTIIAYEPVWAIGTGLTPATDEIQATHAAIRARLPDAAIPILYGGSVKPGNAAEIFAMADVDGGLVGGASLTSADFIPIMQALEKAAS